MTTLSSNVGVYLSEKKIKSAAPSTFLFQVVKNKNIELHLKTQRQRPQEFDEQSTDWVKYVGGQEATSKSERDAFSALVMAEIDRTDKLTPDEKELIIGFHVNGSSIRDLADELGKTENAAKMQLLRARQKMARIPEIQSLYKEMSGREL